MVPVDGGRSEQYRSFGVNYEISLVTRDPALTSRLAEEFLRDLEELAEIDSEK